jgi:serine protease Do
LNVAVYRETQGMGVGFAIPVKTISAAITEFFTPEELPVEGRPALWFGAKFKPAPYPLSITEVRPGTPAEKAGLRVGQLVLQINGRSPRNPMDCAEMLLNSPNRRATLIVAENGARREVKLELPAFEDFFRERLGAELAKLTTTDVDRFGLNPGDGVFVQSVLPDSPADRAGLRPGYLLSQLDDKRVLDLSAAAAVLGGKQSGDAVRVVIRRPERSLYGYTGWRQLGTTVKLR